MFQAIISFVVDQKGATRIDVALIAAVLGVALLDVLVSRGERLSGELSQISVLTP